MSGSVLPKTSGRAHVKTFLRLGWIQRRQTGSHIILSKPGVAAILSIPDHKEVKIPTLRQIVRAAGLTDDEYRTAFDGKS